MEETINAQALKVMTERGISARALAKATELQKDTVLNFLHARRRTQPSVRALICRELGLDPTKTAPTQAQQAKTPQASAYGEGVL